MKKILFGLMMIFCLQSFGQGDNIPISFKIPFNQHLLDYYSPPNNYTYIFARYRWVGGMFDSGLHIPSYCGTPSGLRTGVWPHDGAIAMDTCNNRLYLYSGAAWVRVANFSEVGLGVSDTASMLSNYLRGSTEGWGIDITGTQHKTWLVDSLQVASWYRLYKAIDSLGSVASPYRFGKSGEDVTPAENRSVDFTSAFTMGLRHLSSSTFDADSSVSSVGYAMLSLNKSSNLTRLGTFYRNLTTNQGASLYESSWNSGIPYAQLVSWKNGNPALSNYFRSYTDSLSIFLSAGSPFKIHNLPIGPGTHALRINSANGEVTVADTTSGGGGSGTVTSVSRTNGYGIIASVADPTTTPNITIAADTTHVMSKFDRQFLIDSLQGAGWGPTGPSSETVIQYWMDVSGNTQANFYPSGTGNTVPTTSIAAGWVGGRQLSTSTSTTGGGYIYFGSAAGYTPIAFTPGVRFNYVSTVRLEDLSDGTETFSVVAGFGDEANNYSSIVDGAGFRYAHTDSSGTWIAWTKSNSTITEDATNITVAADTDYDFYVTVIGTVAYFYIDDVLKATITTNVPDGTTRQTSSVTYNKKSAGTTPRFLYVKRLGLGVQKQ